MFSTSEQLPIPSVAELNREMEPYIIQAAEGRNREVGCYLYSG